MFPLFPSVKIRVICAIRGRSFARFAPLYDWKNLSPVAGPGHQVLTAFAVFEPLGRSFVCARLDSTHCGADIGSPSLRLKTPRKASICLNTSARVSFFGEAIRHSASVFSENRVNSAVVGPGRDRLGPPARADSRPTISGCPAAKGWPNTGHTIYSD